MLFHGYHEEINLPDDIELLPELNSDMNISKDIFGEMKRSTKQIEILEIRRMGWVICSIPTYKPYKFYRMQKRWVYLRREDSLARRNETLHTILPKGVIIKMNLKHKLIRLEGVDCGPRGIGLWYNI